MYGRLVQFYHVAGSGCALAFLTSCMHVQVQSSRQFVRWCEGNAITDELDYSGRYYCTSKQEQKEAQRVWLHEANVYARTTIVYHCIWYSNRFKSATDTQQH